MAAERGLTFQEGKIGEYVSGKLAGSTQLASGRYAMIDNGLGFSLVPWQPVLDKRIGQHITGTMRDAAGSSGASDANVSWGCENHATDHHFLPEKIVFGESPVSLEAGGRPGASPSRPQPLRAGACRASLDRMSCFLLL
jgi:hypothetical protein